jgi:CRP-like cAMP-binding protein
MPLVDDLVNLSRIPLFAVFEAGAMNALAFRSESRVLRTGDVLFRRDDVSDGGFILTAGAVELYACDDAAPVLVAGPWTLIGETALIAETTRPVTAIAAEPATVLKISRPQFLDLLARHPDTAAQVHALFCERLREVAEAMKAFGAVN